MLPRDESERLTDLLHPFTSTPDRCWFGIWEGYGFLDEQRYSGIPRVRTPGRAYLLYRGPIAAATSFAWGPTWQSPNLWWPDDRAWCVATEIDLAETYVGGNYHCIDRIVADTELEALRTTIAARVDFEATPSTGDGRVGADGSRQEHEQPGEKLGSVPYIAGPQCHADKVASVTCDRDFASSGNRLLTMALKQLTGCLPQDRAEVNLADPNCLLRRNVLNRCPTSREWRSEYKVKPRKRQHQPRHLVAGGRRIGVVVRQQPTGLDAADNGWGELEDRLHSELSRPVKRKELLCR